MSGFIPGYGNSVPFRAAYGNVFSDGSVGPDSVGLLQATNPGTGQYIVEFTPGFFATGCVSAVASSAGQNAQPPPPFEPLIIASIGPNTAPNVDWIFLTSSTDGLLMNMSPTNSGMFIICIGV